MTPDPFATTPPPPYLAVIFSSIRTPADQGYGEMADRMVALACSQPGFLGIESARGQDGFGITVSYWESEAAVQAWRDQLDHKQAQMFGTGKWYEHFAVRVARVERAYEFSRS